MTNFENLNKAVFEGVGKYQIPVIEPCDVDIRALEWIPFNYANTAKDRENKGVHFYVDDYQFQRLWNDPDRYIPMLKQFGAVCTPDFSQYTDMPVAMRIYNHFRKHWLGAYWRMHSMKVIPTICWSDAGSFEYCLDGEPRNTIISISSVGTQQRTDFKTAFSEGCKTVIQRLEPKEILWYGQCPEEFKDKAFCVEPHYQQIKERRLASGR